MKLWQFLFMNTILRIGLYILAFYAALLVIGLLWYLMIGRHRKIRKVGFEEFVTSITNNGKIRDPHILRNGKWVKTDKTSQNSSPDS
jgi:predicted membrane protein